MYKIVRDDMIGFLPVYSDYGDQVQVYFNKARPISYDFNFRTFLIKVFEFYTIDRLAMKNKFYQMGLKDLAPIVLEDKVFVRFKVRKPRLKGDGAYGYIRVDAIYYIKPRPVPTIVLNTKEEIPILDSFETATNSYCLGLFVDGYLNRA